MSNAHITYTIAHWAISAVNCAMVPLALCLKHLLALVLVAPVLEAPVLLAPILEAPMPEDSNTGASSTGASSTCAPRLRQDEPALPFFSWWENCQQLITMCYRDDKTKLMWEINTVHKILNLKGIYAILSRIWKCRKSRVLVLIFWVKKLVGANFLRFCNSDLRINS